MGKSSIQRVRNPLSGGGEAGGGLRRSAAAALIFLMSSVLLLLGAVYVSSAARVLVNSPPSSSSTEGDPPPTDAGESVGAGRGGGKAERRARAVRRAKTADAESSGGANDVSGGKTRGGGREGGTAEASAVAQKDAIVAEEKAEGEVAVAADVVSIDTPRGTIRIRLRPDLSSESVDYVRRIVASSKPCSSCNLYRAEKPGILQGKMVKTGINPNRVLGKCPSEYLTADGKLPERKCPPHDPGCGCHGPVMKRGMVGWAGGGGGPDFFFNMYQRPADWWGNDHTVWGEVTDGESLAVVDGIFELPATNRGGMTFLDEPIHFDVVGQ